MKQPSNLGCFLISGYDSLQEAIASFQTPEQACFLSTCVIQEGYPAQLLWDQLCEYLTLDTIMATSSKNKEQTELYSTYKSFFEDSGHSLKIFGLAETILISAKVLSELEAFEGHL